MPLPTYEIIEYHDEYVTVQNQETQELLDVSYDIADDIKKEGLFV